MNEEEAIKKLKQMISLNQFIIINQPTDVKGNKDLNDEIKAINYVLNLIEKQKAEIETLKRDFEIVDHECSRLEQEDIRKDMMINLMAEQLANYKYEELICMEIDCRHIEIQNKGKCIGDINCIKEYFENKVKESK